MILLLCSSSQLMRDKKGITSIIHKNNIFSKRFILIPALQSKVDEIKKRHDDLLQELSECFVSLLVFEVVLHVLIFHVLNGNL